MTIPPLIRTLTVGSGVTPDLLSPSRGTTATEHSGARGLLGWNTIDESNQSPPVGNYTPPRRLTREDYQYPQIKAKGKHRTGLEKNSDPADFLRKLIKC